MTTELNYNEAIDSAITDFNQISGQTPCDILAVNHSTITPSIIDFVYSIKQNISVYNVPSVVTPQHIATRSDLRFYLENHIVDFGGISYGAQGAQGPQGATGGGTGGRGDRGIQGNTGLQGHIGITIQGIAGETGDQGATGIPGQSVQGPKGAVTYQRLYGGEQGGYCEDWDKIWNQNGVQGPQGVQQVTEGPAGEDYVSEFIYLQGSNFSNEDIRALYLQYDETQPFIDTQHVRTFIQLVQGPQGPKGENFIGPKGDSGLKIYCSSHGDITFEEAYVRLKGAQGSNPVVLPGLQGPQGILGPQGEDIITYGAQGVQGSQGVQGLQGISGDPGQRGVSHNVSSLTASEINAILNNLNTAWGIHIYLDPQTNNLVIDTTNIEIVHLN